MNTNILKEKLAQNICHIHKQEPVLNILENGSLQIKTCCILFKNQLHLIANEHDE